MKKKKTTSIKHRTILCNIKILTWVYLILISLLALKAIVKCSKKTKLRNNTNSKQNCSRQAEENSNPHCFKYCLLTPTWPSSFFLLRISPSVGSAGENGDSLLTRWACHWACANQETSLSKWILNCQNFTSWNFLK